MEKLEKEILLRKIAQRIKQLRAEKKITQEMIYFDTGINIGRIERGVRDFSMSTLKIICNYMNISAKEFFDGVDI